MILGACPVVTVTAAVQESVIPLAPLAVMV